MSVRFGAQFYGLELSPSYRSLPFASRTQKLYDSARNNLKAVLNEPEMVDAFSEAKTPGVRIALSTESITGRLSGDSFSLTEVVSHMAREMKDAIRLPFEKREGVRLTMRKNELPIQFGFFPLESLMDPDKTRKMLQEIAAMAKSLSSVGPKSA